MTLLQSGAQKDRTEVCLRFQQGVEIIGILARDDDERSILAGNIVTGKPCIFKNSDDGVGPHGDFGIIVVTCHGTCLNQIPFHHLVLASGDRIPFFYFHDLHCISPSKNSI